MTHPHDLSWYHTIDLPGGVTTKGMFDLRAVVPKLPIPASLSGQRCLDVGTCEGFWAFELERRGAAQVVAIDLADPSRRDLTIGVRGLPETTRARQTFAVAHEALDSKVEWRDLSVYDLSPDVVGEFDFVFMGSLLLHLRDPVLALQKVRSVTRGTFLSHDVISPMLTVLAPRTPAARLFGTTQQEWWIPNAAARVRELEAAGFRVERSGAITWAKRNGIPMRPRSFRHHPFTAALLAFKGVPHTWLLARRAERAPGGLHE